MEDIKEIKKEEKSFNQVSWEAPEFRYFEKTGAWFVGTLIVAFALALFAFFQENFMFLIFVIFAEVLVLHWGRQIPKDFTHTITEDGISEKGLIDRSFRSFQAFDIIQDDRFIEIILLPKKKVSTYVRILAPLEKKEQIRSALLKKLPEFEYEENFFEHLVNRMRL